MRIALLGPLEVTDDAGVPAAVSGLRLRRLLARLAVHPGRLVTTQALVDAIWDEAPPAGAASALQSLVSRLRHSLPGGATILRAEPSGYRLRLPADAVDIARFERLSAQGREAAGRGDPATATQCFTQALDLWRGPPFADLGPADFVVAAGVRLGELRLAAIEDHADAALTAGRAGEVIAEIAGLTAAHPLRERLWAVYMRALAAAGRSAEALAAFAELRDTLRRELGTDPSPALSRLHTAILRGEGGPHAPNAGPDPAPADGIRPVPAPGTGPAAQARAGAPRGNLRFALTSFVGREEELQQVIALLDQARLVTLVGPGGAGKTRLAVEVAARRAARTSDGHAGQIGADPPRPGPWPQAAEGPGAEAERGAGEAVAGAEDEAWVVELAAFRDPAQVPATVIATLGLRGAATPDGVLVEALRDRQALIVLDNCEHLIEACARLADAVLGGCRGVRILATSREPLAITGEVTYPVGPLLVPPESAGVERALEFAALRLFADRAAAARPGFILTAQSLPAAVEICRRLDGMPLAIELACARLRTLPTGEIAARLGDRFRLLASGSRTADPRHHTLLAAVEWSWELFTEPERALARRLTVFADGATPEAAEAVCAGDGLPTADVTEVLADLADKSFVQLADASGVPPRYRMLDTIRAYAAGALEASGEADRTRRAHAAYFLAGAETAEPALRTADQLTWLEWLTREQANLTTALRWAVDASDAETAVRLTAALGWFWEMRGSRVEAGAWLRAVLTLPGTGQEDTGQEDTGEEDTRQQETRPESAKAAVSVTVPAAALATAYAFDAMNHTIEDPGRAARSAATARRLAEGVTAVHPVVTLMGSLVGGPDTSVASAAAGLAGLAGHRDPWVAAEAELWLAHAAEFTGDAAGSLAHFASARDRFTALGDRWGLASAMSSLAASYGLTADHTAAITAFSEAERLAAALGAADDAARMRIWRALERLRVGDLAGAHDDLTAARASARAQRGADLVALADVGLGDLARGRGDLAEARARLTGALTSLGQVASLEAETSRIPALTGLGRVALAECDPAGAQAHLDAALALALKIGLGPVIATVAEALAALAVARASCAEAARLLGLAAAARGAADRGSPDVDHTEAAARAGLADLAGRFDAEFAAAASLSSAEAVTALSRLAARTA